MGRGHAIKDDQLPALRAVAESNRTATLQDLCDRWSEQSGVRVCTLTMRQALRRAGLKREPIQTTSSGIHHKAAPRYGYDESHRRSGDPDKYASCLTDAEWALAADLFELPEGSRGRPSVYPKRAMVDACCYVLRGGSSWRMLPKSFPPWLAVHRAFLRWAEQGKFEVLHDRLRAQWRERMNRSVGPSAAVIDSQSTRSSTQGGEHGFDAAKKVKGRKRHVIVDTLGLLLAVTVTAASTQDRDAAPETVALACAKHPTIKALYADQGYAGQCAMLLQQAQGIKVEIVRRPQKIGNWQAGQLPLLEPDAGFYVLPKRWVVERTHAWIEKSRRCVMHHDRSVQAATAWVWLSQARNLLRRLTS